MSDANRVGLRFIEESAWGTTPATPTMQAIRFTGENIGHTRETTASMELRSDRTVADTVQTKAYNQGGFDFEFSAASFDDFMEGGMFSAWTGNVLENGTTEKFYSIEKAILDEAEFFLFDGMMVSSWSLNIQTEQIVTGRFDFMGSAVTLDQSTVAATVTAANTKSVINAMSNVGTIQEGSTLTALSGVFLQNISFTVNNNLRTISQIGSNTLGDIGGGECEITGQLTAYFNSDRLYDKFLGDTESGLTFTLSDAAGNSYVFFFPRIKFTQNDIHTPGKNQDVWESVSWMALYDSSEGCQMRITRTLV